MLNNINKINNFSKSFDTIHEEDEDMGEYDEDTLVVETESHQLNEEVLRKYLWNKNIDHCQVMKASQRLQTLCNKIKGSHTENQNILTTDVQVV